MIYRSYGNSFVLMWVKRVSFAFQFSLEIIILRDIIYTSPYSYNQRRFDSGFFPSCFAFPITTSIFKNPVAADPHSHKAHNESN